MPVAALLGDQLHSIAGRLQAIGERSFWPVWITLTILALTSTALLLRRQQHSAVSHALTDAPPPQLLDRKQATLLPVVLLAVFFCGCIAVAVAGEDFTAYDNSQLTLYSLRGNDFPPPIWPSSGRFFPLGLQAYNLVGRMTRSAVGYHLFPICEMLAVATILLIVNRSLSLVARAWLAVLALTLPSVMASFLGLIYTEWQIIFWLGLMMLSVDRFARTRSVWWGVTAVGCAQFALYYKEPVFLFLLTFAVARIVLRGRKTGSWLATLRHIDTRLDLMIAAVSLAFAAYYYVVVILASSGLRYLSESKIPRLQALEFYLRWDWLVSIFAVFVVLRLYRIARGSVVPDLLWDGLACGAIAYFLAYLAMGLASEYYLAPVDLIATLYLGRFVFLSWSGMSRSLRVSVAVLTAVVFIPSVDLMLLHVAERKFVVQRKSMAADAIVAARRDNPAGVTRLYFPFTTPYGITEFAAYLTYRGVPIEGGPGASSTPGVELFSAKAPATGPCVAIRPFICHSGAPPGDGIAVVFPDDDVLPSDREVYLRLEEKLLARESLSPRRARYFRALQFIWTWTNWV